ncbi:EAL domain-containing protein [Curvibacter sp. CHRR-16]|uniref:putative bifunctional diguanylate cyclase/phosphodiesterase n=1 Tax=Curvibacter sp. CHRR-16 TaxID=2835872 RepID=UPI001BDAE1BE|nr:EAL domain-containing protein [Curvibacter sp. CHRR-16]MBT0570159.1 EAL domain-containing protein [Curvibacter sp. CHRR-16]
MDVDDEATSANGLAMHTTGLGLVAAPVWIFDIDASRIEWANAAALQVWRADSLAELRSRDMGANMSTTVAKRLKQYQLDFQQHNAVFHELWTVYPEEVPVHLNVRFSGYTFPDGRVGMLCEVQGGNEHSPESLRSVEALLHTSAMISLYGMDLRPLYHNPAARSMVTALKASLDSQIVDKQQFTLFMADLKDNGSCTRTLEVRTALGNRWHEMNARLCRDAVTGNDAILVSEVDITPVKLAEAKAQFIALHDTLTGLPNRSHMMSRFEQWEKQATATGMQAALLFIDLDRFKDINDTLGHAAGDEVLVIMAERLRRASGADTMVARLGGDEFLILLTSDDIHNALSMVEDRILSVAAKPMQIGNHSVMLTPSMGVALYPMDGNDISTLMRNADLALYNAKERGRNRAVHFNMQMAQAVMGRTTLENDLRKALELEQFLLHYQPKVDAHSGKIVGAEALLRWLHPRRGLIAPDQFIPVCESIGLIRTLGNWVLQEACFQQVRWSQQGHALQVSVNLSAHQLQHSMLLHDIQTALQTTGCDPQKLELELTESMLVSKDKALAPLFEQIRSIGVQLALDDFGTGYSNLGYLQRIPLQTLKVDKSFVQCAISDRPLTGIIANLCQVMGFRAVAEGVETEEQLNWLRSLGIEQYQGFLFSKPLPVSQFDALLQSHHR